MPYNRIPRVDIRRTAAHPTIVRRAVAVIAVTIIGITVIVVIVITEPSLFVIIIIIIILFSSRSPLVAVGRRTGAIVYARAVPSAD